MEKHNVREMCCRDWKLRMMSRKPFLSFNMSQCYAEQLKDYFFKITNSQEPERGGKKCLHHLKWQNMWLSHLSCFDCVDLLPRTALSQNLAWCYLCLTFCTHTTQTPTVILSMNKSPISSPFVCDKPWALHGSLEFEGKSHWETLHYFKWLSCMTTG